MLDLDNFVTHTIPAIHHVISNSKDCREDVELYVLLHLLYRQIDGKPKEQQNKFFNNLWKNIENRLKEKTPKQKA